MTPTTLEESRRHEEVIRQMIHRENELIHHRVTWLTAVQGLLFAGLGVAWSKPESRPLVAIFCVLGILMSLVSLAALSGASIATLRLLRWWDEHRPPLYAGPDVIGIRPSLGWIGPWSLIPIIFILAWVTVWILRF